MGEIPVVGGGFGGWRFRELRGQDLLFCFVL